MKIHLLSLGQLHMTEEMLYGENYPKDVVIESPAWAVLIQREDALVLIDCGCQQLPDIDPATAPMYSYRPEELITRQLARFGCKPEDITHLILTHSHTDHAGNTHLFHNAAIYIDATEYACALAEAEAARQGRGSGMPVGHLLRWNDPQLHFRPVDEPRLEPLPGITLVRFPRGHAEGFLAVVLNGRGRSILLASDLAYTEKAMGKNPPTLVTDLEGYLKGIDLLADLAREYDAEVWFGHSAQQFHTLRDKTLEL